VFRNEPIHDTSCMQAHMCYTDIKNRNETENQVLSPPFEFFTEIVNKYNHHYVAVKEAVI